MPSMSATSKSHVITTNQDGQHDPTRCSPLDMSNMQASPPSSTDTSPHRLRNIALSDMLSEFQDEGISSPPPGTDLTGVFNSEEASIVYTGECMEMNNDILDLSKPLPWDRLKKGNSSMSLDSLNDNYIDTQGDEEIVVKKDGTDYCTCGANLSPGCPVHRERALLEEEIRTCCTLVKNLRVETPNDNISLGLMKERSKDDDDDGDDEDQFTDDFYNSLKGFDSVRTKHSVRTLELGSGVDSDSYSTSSTTDSLKLDSKGSQNTEGASSTNSSNGSFQSVPSVHRSDLSSSPESYDLLYKSFEVASLVEKDEYSEGDETSSPTVTPLEIFNQASPKLQKYLTEKQQEVLEDTLSENNETPTENNDAQCSPDSQSSNTATVDSSEGQKVTTFAQLAKSKKKPQEVLQAPQTLTVKPTHWSELVANQDKNDGENEEEVKETSPDTPKRPHSLAIQLRYITKPACRPTQTPEKSLPPPALSAGSICGLTRTLSAPEGFVGERMKDVHQSESMTRTISLGQSHATTVDAPNGNVNGYSLPTAPTMPVHTSPPPSLSAMQNRIDADPLQSTRWLRRPTSMTDGAQQSSQQSSWMQQHQLQRAKSMREYSPSPSLDINANFTDDDLDGSSLCSSQQDDFRINDFIQQTPENNLSKTKRSVSWCDFPEGFEASTMRFPTDSRVPAVTANNITTFKKMVKTTSTASRPLDFAIKTDFECMKDMDTMPNLFRERSATIGSQVSLKDLWHRIEEEHPGEYSSPNCTSWNGVNSKKPITTWAESSQQPKLSDVERVSVGCQASAVNSPESCGDLLKRCNSFEAMLAENGLGGSELQSMSCGMRCAEIGHPADVPWYAARPRSQTILSLHRDSTRTLQNVRSQKFAPKVKTWLVDCNQTKPSRVTCEDTFSHEQRPRRLVRIENITDASDVKYIRHRPLKPIHVVDAEHQRRKALQELNALDAPSTTSPSAVRYAPSFGEFISSTEQYQSLPPNLTRYRNWLHHSDGQSQLPKETNQPMRERLASESAVDMQRGYLRRKMDQQQQSAMEHRQRPHSLVLASYYDDGIESLPPQEIPISPRYTAHRDTVDMLRKRAIVAAIDGAVDHILGHFSQAINKSPLEKVRLGDSQQTPNIGHIVLHYLCPAIADLLTDGLRPHMQSFIVGRVKTTVWTPVEATTKLGPGTRSLYELSSMLSKKRCLREPSLKTNAFIFGLLNTRNVEVWLEHIRSHPDIVRTLYAPEAFLTLCNTSTRQLFDKLLLALQPLAILPFNLDYEFEYSHMQQQASAEREKQQLLEQHAAATVPCPVSVSGQQGSVDTPEGGRLSSGRLSSLLGRSRKKDFTRSNSWTSSLSTSLGFRKTFAGQNTGVGQPQSSEQSDRLLRTEQVPPPQNITQDRLVSSAECTPTNNTQSWSMDWIKSFVAANDQSQPSKTVDSSAGVQTASTTNSWSRLGASVFKAFDRRKRQTEVQENSAINQQPPQLVSIEERPHSPPTTPSSPNLSKPWNTASPGSPMKALCHHITMSPGELSFSKGDILTVDHQVDPDWILCHHGSESGLVHIDYVQGFE